MDPEPKEPENDRPTQAEASEAAPGFTPVNAPQAPPFQMVKPRMSTNEVIRRSLLGITLGVLGIAILVFLSAINAVIEVWLRHQWVPIARSVAALVVIAVCLAVLYRLTNMRGQID